MQAKRILWLSDGPGLTTGYATISRKLLNYLADYGWECHFLSHTGNHQTFKPGLQLEDNESFKFHVHGAGLAPYCQDIIVPKIRELKPSIFGILLDTFMVHPGSHGGNPWFFNLDFAPAKSLFYFPSDGGGKLKDGKFVPGRVGPNFPLGCDQVLRKVDKAVAMARFGQQQVADPKYNIKSDYIPHAIEPEIYKPLPEQEREQLKRAWGLSGKFVVGVVARNQGRKMLDRTFYAFSKVAKEIPEAVLFCHTDKHDPASYFNPDGLINELGLQNRVIFTGTRYFKGFDYKKMNEVYNLMDLFVLGTSGEGFGIPIIEAMACCIPVLVTDYTTTWELVERTKSGEAIKLSDEILGNWGVGRGLMDIDDCAERIIRLYKNPLLRKEYGLNGRTAVLSEYTWQIVAKQWNDLLEKML